MIPAMTKEDEEDVDQQQVEQQTPSSSAEQNDALRLKGEEEIVRKKAKRNPLFLFLVNSVATIFVFIFHLISVSRYRPLPKV
jgi:cytoskeletal protein RodZ